MDNHVRLVQSVLSVYKVHLVYKVGHVFIKSEVCL